MDSTWRERLEQPLPFWCLDYEVLGRYKWEKNHNQVDESQGSFWQLQIGNWLQDGRLWAGRSRMSCVMVKMRDGDITDLPSTVQCVTRVAYLNEEILSSISINWQDGNKSWTSTKELLEGRSIWSQLYIG